MFALIDAPVNVELAKRVLDQEFPKAKVWIYTSGYNGAKTIHLESDNADFEGYPASDDSNPSYLLNGALAGNDAQILEKVQSVFQKFESASFSMSIEAYDLKGEIIGEFTNKRIS